MPSSQPQRPQTSKPRGICNYYREPRGCFAGDACKFLHSEAGEPSTVHLTPYDRAKTCKYYAAGFCKRENNCWFLHVKPDVSSPSEEDELCSICFEQPSTYGLLSGCSHIFCIKCIRLWRDPNGKSVDVRLAGVNKSCPMCRAPTKFITPSSLFFQQGDPRKDQALEAYKLSMARVPCRYFMQSRKRNPSRACPFGKDCYYQHLNEDGTPFVFQHGVKRSMQAYRRQRFRLDIPTAGPSRSPDSEDFSESFDDFLYGVATSIDHSLFTRNGLGLLSDMLSSFHSELTGDEPPEAQQSDADSDDAMPELECLDSDSDSELGSGNDDPSTSSTAHEDGSDDGDDNESKAEDNVEEAPRPFLTDGRGRVIGANPG